MNTIKIFLISMVLTLGLFSCRNEDLNPLPEITTRVGLVTGEQTINTSTGTYIIVRENPIGDQLGVDDPIIEIEVESPQGTVDSYTLMAKISGMDLAHSSDPTGFGDYTPLVTVTEFPTTISLSLAEFAAIFDMEPVEFSNSATTTAQYVYFLGTSVSNGITVNLDNVTGAGFSSADNPDGVASGLTNLYQESRMYALRYFTSP